MGTGGLEVNIPGDSCAEYIGLRVFLWVAFVVIVAYGAFSYRRLRRAVRENCSSGANNGDVEILGDALRRAAGRLFSFLFLTILTGAAAIASVCSKDFRSVELRSDHVVLRYYYGRPVSLGLGELDSIELKTSFKGESEYIVIRTDGGRRYNSIGGSKEDGDVAATYRELLAAITKRKTPGPSD